jgi:hypothetical protein
MDLADVLRRYGEDYLARFGAEMPSSHRKAMADLVACRTAALGGHVYRCQACGHDLYEYHSCRNSACPKCNGNRRDAWLKDRRSEMLPVPYFHLVFTLPQEVATIARSHQRLMYGILFQATADALQTLAADPRYVGGRVAILAVLHTWTRTLTFHPHVHCLVPGGGLSADNAAWLSANPAFLVPVRALSKLFRARFQDLLRRTDVYDRVPATVWRLPWVVYSKPTVNGSDQVLDYLGRYVCRVALSQGRIVSADDGTVRFTYQQRATPGHSGGRRYVTLTAQEFIRRFLQHVLPEHFIKVRYFGFWAPACKRQMQAVRELLHADVPHESRVPLQANNPPPEIAVARKSQPSTSRHCHHCGGDNLSWAAELPRPRLSPMRCLSP